MVITRNSSSSGLQYEEKNSVPLVCIVVDWVNIPGHLQLWGWWMIIETQHSNLISKPSSKYTLIFQPEAWVGCYRNASNVVINLHLLGSEVAYIQPVGKHIFSTVLADLCMVCLLEIVSVLCQHLMLFLHISSLLPGMLPVSEGVSVDSDCCFSGTGNVCCSCTSADICWILPLCKKDKNTCFYTCVFILFVVLCDLLCAGGQMYCWPYTPSILAESWWLNSC